MCDDEERSAMALNMTKLNVSHQLCNSSEIDRRFPGIKSHGLCGIYEEEAGILKADDCLWALKVSSNA